ncbi:MFS transporter [Erwinia sp. MYb416]|uniref:MFS transporter n=1 Tax=Erwinia sp. MYb416 TaxID=3108532 RepID=UPI00403F1273
MHKSDVTLRKEKVPLFRPFRHRTFRHLCVANFMANIGSWMQIFATGWLVASQTRDLLLWALCFSCWRDLPSSISLMHFVWHLW